MTSISQILQGFKTTSLGEISEKYLESRTDLKFCFAAGKLPALLKELAPAYTVLSVDNNLIFNYRTQYFDTPGFDLYLAHHNKRFKRYKIRQRTYMETGKAYLEIKWRNRLSKTQKERILLSNVADSWSKTELDFISSKTPYRAETLLPSVLVNYRRMTLLNTSTAEKITIDLGLEFSNAASDFKLNHVVILEVKQLGKFKTPVLSLLRNMEIRPVAFSKYCSGINYLYPYLKKNNFKKHLITLKKLADVPVFYIPANG